MNIVLIALLSLANGSLSMILRTKSVYITATPNENYWFEIGDFENKETKISPTSEIVNIQNGINVIEKKPYNKIEKKEIISQKLYKSYGYLGVTNYMTILSELENMFFIEYNSANFLITPDIDNVIQLTIKQNSICYDAVQLKFQYVIECSNEDGYYFALLNKDQIQYFSIKNQDNQQRKLDQVDDILLRTLQHSLELYQLQEDNIVLLSTLDTQILKQLSGDDSFELQIIDFKFHTNHRITILNQQAQFLHLNYDIQQNKWDLVQYLPTGIETPLAYNCVFEDEKKGYRFKLSIISDKFLYGNNFDTSLNKLKEINSDPKDRIYYPNVILKNQKSLYFIYENKTIEFQSKIFVNEYDRLYIQNILIFDQQYFYAYYLDDTEECFGLRFSSNKLMDEYQKFTYEEIIDYKSYKLDVYFKVVEPSVKNLYKALEIQPIFLYLKKFQIEGNFFYLQSIYGSNVQLEFYPHETLNLTFNKTQPMIIHAGDSKNVIYRKILPLDSSRVSDNVAIIIQQTFNQTVTAYKCLSIEEDIPKQLECQQLFQIDNFIQLIDSSFQSWYYDEQQISFAIAIDSRVDIYSNNEQVDQFSKIISFNLDNQIDKIVLIQSQIYLLSNRQYQKYILDFQQQKAELTTQLPAENFFINLSDDFFIWIYYDNTLSTYTQVYDDQKYKWDSYLERKIILDKKQIPIDIGCIFHQYQSYLFILIKENDTYFGRVYKHLDYSKYLDYKKVINFDGYTQIKFSEGGRNNEAFIFLEAKKDGISVLLVYRIWQLVINTLYTELKLSDNSQISASRYFLLITDKKNFILQQYFMFKDTRILAFNYQIDKNYRQVNCIQTIDLRVRFYNQYISQESNVPVQIVNDFGSDLFGRVNQLNFIYDKDDGVKNHCFELGQSWYGGQAFDIELQEPFENIKYSKTIIKQSESLEYCMSIEEFDDNTLVQLMSNKIVLISKKDFKSTEFLLNTQYSFTKILYILDNLIYVEAKNTQYYILVIQCIDYNCKLLEGFLEIDTQVLKLHVNQKHFFISFNNKVLIYDIKKDLSKLQEFQIIDIIELPFETSTIEFSQLIENVYQIISIDEECRVLFINFEISNQLNITRTQITDPQFHYFFQRSCYHIFIKNDEIIISPFPRYTYKFETLCVKNDCQITQLKPTYQIYGYPDLDNFGEFNVKENILTQMFEYRTEEEVFKKEVFFYDIETVDQNLETKKAFAHLTLTSKLDIKFLIYNYEGQLHLLITIDEENRLKHFLLRKSIEVCTEKETIYQDVSFILKNSYNTEIAKLKLNITSNNPPNPDPPGPNPPGPNPPGPDPDPEPQKTNWKQIAIIGGGVVAFFAICTIIYYCCKKKKPQGLLDS